MWNLCYVFCRQLFLKELLKKIRWDFAVPDVKDKVVFISGGSSGIGEEMAKQMVKLGAKKIIIASRRLEELERVRQECQNPKIVETFQLDLSKPEECLEKTTKLFDKERIDILVNNGGVS